MAALIHYTKVHMKLTLHDNEIKEILLAWVQKNFKEGEFNTIEMATYTYEASATFTCEEKTDEAL